MPRELKIFISSPGDVPDERLRAALIIDKLSQEFSRFFALKPYDWQYEPMLASGTFQDSIEPPSAHDIVILILWSRLGTPLPDRFHGLDGRHPVTGTEWEFEDALKSAKERGAPAILAFRNRNPALVDSQNTEAQAQSYAQLQALDRFWKHYFVDHGVFEAAFTDYGELGEFAQRLEEALRKLIKKRVDALQSEPGLAPIWPGDPFRGLETYEFEHAPIFFGRDGAIAKAAEQLAVRARSGTAFLLVSGPSGSGKSSLVKAALVPRLMKPQRITGTAFLRRAIFRPGDGAKDLIGGLVDVLVRETGKQDVALPELLAPGQNAAGLITHLSAMPDQAGFVFAGALGRLTELERKLGRILGFEEAKLILVIDQLEEVFTLASVTAKERRLFIRLLAGLARSGAVWIIATIRADFWHRAAEEPDLLALAEGTGRIDLTPPSRAELGDMIRKPAEAAALSFEINPETMIGLDGVLADRASTAPGVLPLLSFTLDALYEQDIVKAKSHVLTFATYEDLGGLEGAIATRADDCIAALPTSVQAALPRVLRTLATVSNGTDEVALARVVPLNDFPEGGDSRIIVDAMIAARLLVASDEGTTPTVRLAHEALITHWKRAKDQLVTDRRDLETRNFIESQYGRWRAAPSKKQNQLLLRDPDLASAVDLERRWGDELSADICKFIQISYRRAQFSRRLLVGAAVAFALLVAGTTVLGGIAYYLSGVAYRSALIADLQRKLAQSNADLKRAQAASDVATQKLNESEDEAETLKSQLEALQNTLVHERPIGAASAVLTECTLYAGNPYDPDNTTGLGSTDIGNLATSAIQDAIQSCKQASDVSGKDSLRRRMYAQLGRLYAALAVKTKEAGDDDSGAHDAMSNAITALDKSLKLGSAYAMVLLGSFFDGEFDREAEATNFFVNKDQTKAIALFQQSGIPIATTILAQILLERNDPSSQRQALTLLEQAEEQNYSRAFITHARALLIQSGDESQLEAARRSAGDLLAHAFCQDRTEFFRFYYLHPDASKPKSLPKCS